jgi:hypothetical protein
MLRNIEDGRLIMDGDKWTDHWTNLFKRRNMKIKVKTEEGKEFEAIIDDEGCLHLSDSEDSKKSEEGLGEYVIIRAESAGVFAGYLKEKDGNEVVLNRAIRIWYWDGAASLSQLAMEGVSKPENCKFTCEVDDITILRVIEIITTTSKAKKCIQSVKIWKV